MPRFCHQSFTFFSITFDASRAPAAINASHNFRLRPTRVRCSWSRQFDADNNGYLDHHELKAAFIASGRPATDATIAHSFSLIDKDHDGKISLEEFKAMASQNVLPSLAKMFAQDNGRAFEENGEHDHFSNAYSGENAFEFRRDKKLWQEHPQRYCADRCLATGYCEVLEDIYEMTTSQVRQFCENCAGDDECELSYA